MSQSEEEPQTPKSPVDLASAFTIYKDDPVALMAQLEVEVREVNRQDVPKSEKESYLRQLKGLLETHHQIVGKIGWDLMRQLLEFFELENVSVVDVDSLRKDPIIKLTMRCFNIIALHGDPKECLLSACTLLSKLSVKSEQKNPQLKEAEGMLGSIKIHILMEMIGATFRRISTVYPSKYLGQIVSAIEQLNLRNAEYFDDVILVLRRVQTFIRDYMPPDVPEDILERVDANGSPIFTEEKLAEIRERENKLQAVLLRSLCTSTLAQSTKGPNMKSEFKYFYQLTNKPFELTGFYPHYFELQSRFYNTILSLDVDLVQEFNNLLAESRRIYQAIPDDKDITTEEAHGIITQFIFKLSYIYRIQKLASEKEVQMNPEGILSLSAVHYLETDRHLVEKIPLDDAIYLYLAYATPPLYSKVYDRPHVEGAARYWLWIAITRNSYQELVDQISSIKLSIVKVFLQTLLLRACRIAIDELRMINNTLIMRVLCLLPEDIVYEFIHNTLVSFPYPHGKSSALVFLKDLILSPNPHREANTDIAEELSHLKLNEDNEVSPVPKHAPYIELTRSRMKDIYTLAIDAIKVASQPDAIQTDINLVASYLNFMHTFRDVWNKKEISRVDRKAFPILSKESRD